MKILSVLNNSALIAKNENNEEVVLIGKGISFQKHAGDSVDISKVEKQFSNGTQKTNELFELFDEIPEQYFEITCSIVRYANKKLQDTLNNGIYISLFDHINSAMERFRDGIQLPFGMMNEIKLLYPKEYEISVWALDYINATLDVDLPEDECGFISIHIINASSSECNITKTKKIIRMANEIASIVKEYFDEEIDEDSMSYSRFMTHLKYFIIRCLNGKQMQEEVGVSLSFKEDMIHLCDPCLNQIRTYLKENYDVDMQKDEENYLMLHLCRLLVK